MENRKKTPKLKEKVKEKEYWDDGRTCTDTDDDKKEEEMKPKETIEEAKLLLKPKRERTQAQIDAFEKAKEKRMEYAELRKKGITEVKETYKKKHYVKKADRVEEPKPVEKLPVETKPKPKAKKEKPEPKSESESEEEPVKVVEKPKKVKKQPRVIFQDATDESDSENEIIIIKKKNKNKVKKEKEPEPAPAKEPAPASNSNAFIIPPVPARKLFFV